MNQKTKQITLILFSLLAIFILTACSTQVQQARTEPTAPVVAQNTEPTVQIQPTVPTQTQPAPQVQQAKPALGPDTIKNTIQEVNPAPAVQVASVKEFTMTAKNWEFTPSTIQVNKGDSVVLKITSTDVTHGFNLPDFNIKEDLKPGQEVVVKFTADKTGTFNFHCDVFCGSGHREMTGQLIVK